jgi:hypothetical protein
VGGIVAVDRVDVDLVFRVDGVYITGKRVGGEL